MMRILNFEESIYRGLRHPSFNEQIRALKRGWTGRSMETASTGIIEGGDLWDDRLLSDSYSNGGRKTRQRNQGRTLRQHGSTRNLQTDAQCMSMHLYDCSCAWGSNAPAQEHLHTSYVTNAMTFLDILVYTFIT